MSHDLEPLQLDPLQLDEDVKRQIAFTMDFVNRGLYREAISSSALALRSLAALLSVPLSAIPAYLITQSSTDSGLTSWYSSTADKGRGERDFARSAWESFRELPASNKFPPTVEALLPEVTLFLREKFARAVAMLRAKAFIGESEWQHAVVLLYRLAQADERDGEIQGILDRLHRYHPYRVVTLENRVETKCIPPLGRLQAGAKRSIQLSWGVLPRVSISGEEALVQFEDGYYLIPGPLSPVSGATRSLILSDREESVIQIANACSLLGVGSDNFFHWIVEHLPRAVMAERLGFTGPYLVPKGGAFIDESLRIIGVDSSRIVRYEPTQRYEVENLFYIQPSSRELVVPYGDVYEYIRSRFLAAASAQGSASPCARYRRVYLQRTRERVVRNEAELSAILERYQVHVFNFDNVSLLDQIRIIGQAELVVGPHGAALTHTLFMPRGSTVIEIFSPNFVNYCFLGLAELSGVRYLTATAQNADRRGYPAGDDVIAPPNVLELYLGQALGGRSP